MREEMVQDVNMRRRCLCWWQCQYGGLGSWWALHVCCWAWSLGSRVFAAVSKPLQSMVSLCRCLLGSALLPVLAFGMFCLVPSLASI